ncbi:hypothetical protein LCGC14_2207430, partial [marine sediment metagenome]
LLMRILSFSSEGDRLCIIKGVTEALLPVSS